MAAIYKDASLSQTNQRSELRSLFRVCCWATKKVIVKIKQAYTSNVIYPNFKAYYRLYVKEGTTEVIVQDWTRINQTPNEYYFIFDTKDKIPNEYYVDIKVLTSGEVDTYKRELKFQIVNQKWKI